MRYTRVANQSDDADLMPVSQASFCSVGSFGHVDIKLRAVRWKRKSRNSHFLENDFAIELLCLDFDLSNLACSSARVWQVDNTGTLNKPISLPVQMPPHR